MYDLLHSSNEYKCMLNARQVRGDISWKPSTTGSMSCHVMHPFYCFLRRAHISSDSRRNDRIMQYLGCLTGHGENIATVVLLQTAVLCFNRFPLYYIKIINTSLVTPHHQLAREMYKLVNEFKVDKPTC